MDLIVIHGISLPPGRFGTGDVERLFCNCLPVPGALAHSRHDADRDTPWAMEALYGGLAGLRVSAHFLVERGGRLTQFVPLGARAWHAGRSSWKGRERCNDFSVGIELEGTDHEPYAEPQYAALVELCARIREHFPGIPDDGIAGHSDIAPGRKTDPGPLFEWERLAGAGLRRTRGGERPDAAPSPAPGGRRS